MTTYPSNIATEQNAAICGSSAKLPQGQLISGQLVMAHATVNTKSEMIAGDVIEVVRLPKGAIVVPHLSKIHSSGLGTAFKVTLGSPDEPTHYSAELDIKTAGEISFTGGICAAGTYTLATGEPVNMYITTATSVTKDKPIAIKIAYVIP